MSEIVRLNRYALALLAALLYCSSVLGEAKLSVKLDVPVVEQGGSLCGPATIEMLFRYWGVDKYSQYDIAASILEQFAESKRYLKSGILDTQPVDWRKYPGTGTINMREFLRRFAKTKNYMLEYLPHAKKVRDGKVEKVFANVKRYISQGIPVIVHQYWKLPKSRGHYRLVTGFDDVRQEVYLNDADGGKRIVQSYEDFLKLWNVDQRWLHYNAVVFNIDGKRLDVAL